MRTPFRRYGSHIDLLSGKPIMNIEINGSQKNINMAAISAKRSMQAAPSSLGCNFIYIFYKCRATQSYWQKFAPVAFFTSEKLAQLALVGSGIQPQNDQRDNFTHRPPCFNSITFGAQIIVKSSLTSGFFQRLASTHHSNFMMPVWGLLQWQMAQKIHL